MRDIFFDIKGAEIKEFDVLKVFNFIGDRRKKHYMYKWVRRNEKGELCITHLDGSNTMVSLFACCKRTSAGWIFEDTEIIQSYH